MKLKVLLLDTKPSNPNHYICLAIYYALQKHPKIEAVYLASFGDAITLAQSNHCNLFFAFDGEGLNTEICRRLKEICGYAIVWNTEDPYELPVNLAHSDLFDHVFTNDSASVSAYGGKATHLPLAASEEFQYHPVLGDEACRYDLFFAGTAWPNRVQLIGRLANLMDGSLRMKLAMPSNAHLPVIDNLPFAPSVYSWRTSNIEFARFANQSRITLGLHRDFSTTPGAPTVAMTPGPRIFEVAMAGGFQLVDQALAETSHFFVPGQELITFDGEKDCLDKVDYFLTHPDERVAIARLAQEKALGGHTYSARVESILASLPFQRLAQVQAHAHRPVRLHIKDIAAPKKIESAGRRRILYVIHNQVGNNMWGGVELYQDAIRKKLNDGFEVYIYSPVGSVEGEYREYGLFNERLEQVEAFLVNSPWNLNLLSCNERERIFSELLIKHQIELVHFQHLMLHVPSLPFIASALGIPTIYTYHDYYGICIKFNLVGMYGNYCGVETMPLSGCDTCLHKFSNSGGQAIRREFYARMFEKINVIHVGTKEVFDRVKSVYPTLGVEKFLIRGIPVVHDTIGGVIKNSSREHQIQAEKKQRMQAVIFGNFTVTKGAGQILHALRGLQDCPLDIHIHGRIDSDIQEMVENLDQTNVFFHGGYFPEDIKDILVGKDIAIFAPIWPETYSLALSEVVLSGVVPIAPNLGSFSVRITDRVNGFLYEDRNIGQLISIIQELVYAPMLVDSARAQLALVPAEKICEHTQWLRGIYTPLLSQVYWDKTCPSAATSVNRSFTLKDCGILLNHPYWTALSQEVKVIRIEASIVTKPFLQRTWKFYKANGLSGVIKRLWRLRVKIT